MKTFFSHIKNFFLKLFGSNSSLERTLQAALTVIAPMVESIIALTAGEPASALVKNIIDGVQSDLAAVSALTANVQTGLVGNTYQQVSNVISAVQSNLSALLTAGHVKDPATLSKVTTIVNGVSAELTAILSELSTVTPPSPSSPVQPVTPSAVPHA